MARPRKSDVPSELSPSPVEAAPRKRGRPRKTETVKAAQSVATPEIKKSQKIEKIAKVSKVRKPAKAKTPPDTKIDGIADGVAPEPAPKRKRGAPLGNSNGKGNKGKQLGNQNAVGNSGPPPKLTVDERLLKEVEGCGRLHCTEAEMGMFFGVSEDTINRLMREDERVSNAFYKGIGIFKISLRRKQSRLAESNASMAIHLGKNYLGQKDKIEHSGDANNPLHVNVRAMSVGQFEEVARRVADAF